LNAIIESDSEDSCVQCDFFSCEQRDMMKGANVRNLFHPLCIPDTSFGIAQVEHKF